MTDGSRPLTRRRFIGAGAGLVGAASLGLLDACTGSGDTLNFMHPAEPTGVVQQQIDRWNDRQPKYPVVWLQAPTSVEQYFEQLRSQFQAGGGPLDVISGDVTWTAELGANGWVTDLTSEVQGAYPRGTFLGAWGASASWDGKVWAVPWIADLGLLWYRADLLRRAGIAGSPATEDQLLAIAADVVKQAGIPYGLVYPGAPGEDQVCTTLEYIWSAGGDVLDPGNPTRVVIGDAAAINGLAAQRGTITSGVTPAEVAGWRQEDAIASFLSGDAVFLRGPSSVRRRVGWQGSGAHRVTSRAQVGAAAPPVAAAGSRPASCAAGWLLFVNATSRKKEQAWPFVAYLADTAQSQERARAGYPSPRAALYRDHRVRQSATVLGLAEPAVADARPRPDSPVYADLSLRMQALFGQSLRGTVTPPAAAAQLEADLQQIVDEGG